MKCYQMLQNARVTAFTVSELLRENQQGGGGVELLPPHPDGVSHQMEGHVTKFKIVWIKITTFFKRRVSIIL